jgi:hypothetical protein
MELLNAVYSDDSGALVVVFGGRFSHMKFCLSSQGSATSCNFDTPAHFPSVAFSTSMFATADEPSHEYWPRSIACNEVIIFASAKPYEYYFVNYYYLYL